MAAAYREDTDRLGLGRPDAEPLATEYVGQIVSLIGELLDRGSAYAASGDVYFRVRGVEGYGELSRRDLDQMDQGEGVEGADLKEDPLDFALWKAWKEGEDTSWDAPWGRGRPGWHIECSAMAEALLGVSFDIHGGGIDLVFPHHENEAAQTFAARGEPLARIWMHNGMLELGAEKMAKSVGNIRGLSEVLDDVGPEVAPVVHEHRPLPPAAGVLRRGAREREGVRRAHPRGGAAADRGPVAGRRSRRTATRFFAALRNDFNTAEALASLYGWIREANRSEEAVGNAHLVEMLVGARAGDAGRRRGGRTTRGRRAGRGARRRARGEGLG